MFLVDKNKLAYGKGAKQEDLMAFQLSSKIKEIGEFYSSLSNGNQDLKSTISNVCNVDEVS